MLTRRTARRRKREAKSSLWSEKTGAGAGTLNVTASNSCHQTGQVIVDVDASGDRRKAANEVTVRV